MLSTIVYYGRPYCSQELNARIVSCGCCETSLHYHLQLVHCLAPVLMLHLLCRCHSSSSPSVDDKEAAKFAALAAHWWDKQSGPFAALHAMNPTRLRFIQDTVADQIQRVTGAAAAGAGIAESGALPLQDVEVLDVGCGGGLLSETLARAGAKVRGWTGRSCECDLSLAESSSSRRVSLLG